MAEGGHEEIEEVNDTMVENENTADLATKVPLYDMEYANRELEAARKAHKKLMEEKIALTEALSCRKSKIQAVIDETNRIENRRNDLQEDIDAVHEKLKLENDAIEEMHLSKQKDLAESESLEEYHKHLLKELEEREMLKEKKEMVMKDLYSKIAEKKMIVSNLLKEKKCFDNVNVYASEEPEDFCAEEDKEIREKQVPQQHIEEELQLARDKISEMEKRREELCRTALEKSQEMEIMRSKIKDVETINTQATNKLEDLQNTLAKLDYQVANERNKNRVLNTKAPRNEVSQSGNVESAIVDEMKVSNADHEIALYDIKRRTDDILSDFDKKMKALKRTKTKKNNKKVKN